MKMSLSFTVGLLVCAGAFFVASCTLPSDEEVLRRTFDIPSDVKLSEMDVSPKEAGWFGREGLTIDARFQFTDKQFTEYSRNVETDPLWKPLPPSKAFLMRMLGVRRSVEGLKRSYEMRGEELPKEGSVYNPTAEQLYERGVKRLPLDVTDGWYQCKTAGDNLMYSRKRPCDAKEGDLNDYMLAVLDVEKKQLRIRAQTKY